jgi:thiosulfate/3-mercaptopyruvate sulfurtransferase
VDPDGPIIATCGSGVSACALILALHLLGHRQVSLYDGAWAEWGGRDDTPVERGAD